MRWHAQVDTPLVQNVKALIRYTEATSAAGAAGVPEQRCHFLSMPFYETGAPLLGIRSRSRTCFEQRRPILARPTSSTHGGRLAACYKMPRRRNASRPEGRTAALPDYRQNFAVSRTTSAFPGAGRHGGQEGAQRGGRAAGRGAAAARAAAPGVCGRRPVRPARHPPHLPAGAD